MMTEIRGASNAKAKRELGWQPRHASLARGLPHGEPRLTAVVRGFAVDGRR